MVGFGEPVYNTEQRRKMLRQMKQYFDEQWLKRKSAGKLGKRIRLPNSKKQKAISKKRRRKRRIRLFKVIRGKKYGNQIVFKQVKKKKRKNRKYKK